MKHQIEIYIALLFSIALILELVLMHLRNQFKFYKNEFIKNILIGLISISFDVAISLITLPLLYMIYQFKIIDISQHANIYWIILFLVLDFIEYWNHKISHDLKIFWAAHSIHHQGSTYQLSLGLRTSFLVPFINIPFYLPLAFLGFLPEHIVLMVFISAAYQLFIHTEYVGNLGFLEKILMTPLNHQIHHAQNDIYLNKNFGKILIIWDKIFGTYISKTEDIKYGISNENFEFKTPISCIIQPVYKLIFKK